jgi:hypothetical protein
MDAPEEDYDEQAEKAKKIKKIKRKLRRFKMPKDKLLVMKNPDKGYHESWSKGRSKLNIPHPFRALVIGLPNSGKGVCCLNLLLAQGIDKKIKGANKPFEEVYVCHCDGDSTKEYRNCGATFLPKIPAPKEWNSDKKKLLILDDLSYKDMNKFQKEALKRAWAYVSTHKNLSCIMTLQDLYDLNEPLVRRCTNLFILFPSIDYTSLNTINRKLGLKKGDLEQLFKKYCKNNHDSIWLDMTADNTSPYKMRLNGFKIIERT